jgi:hypothetical protein
MLDGAAIADEPGGLVVPLGKQKINAFFSAPELR